jgi:DNA-binding CsgD family transcriptional regulator
MTTYDRTGRLVAASPTFIETFGPEVERCFGQRPPYPWWPEDRRDEMIVLFDKVIRMPGSTFVGIEMVVHLQSPDGSRHSHAVCCERLPDGSTVVTGRPLVEVDCVARAIGLLRESLADAAGEDPGDSGSWGEAQMELLSPRERNVYRLLVEGSSAAKIAETLFLSIHTVRNHRKAIYRKLGVSSQVELIRMTASN